MVELLASFTYTPMQRWGPVSPHGVGTALGFFLGAYLMARRAEPRGVPRTEVYNAVTWGALGAIIGARGFYVIGHLDQFDSVRDMVAVWEGGLTMFGGFVGGLALGLWYLRRHKFSIPLALDAAAPGFVVGVIVGRIGDIFIGDHLGNPTNFPLGYKIPNAPLAPGYGPPTYVPGAVVHHTALYDLIGALVLLAVIYRLEKRKPRTGTLFAAFSVWYGLQRLLIDFTRNRDAIESFFLGLSGSQWAGVAFAIGGIVWLVRMRTREAEPEPEAVRAAAAAMSVAAPVDTGLPPAAPPPVDAPPAGIPIDPIVPTAPPPEPEPTPEPEQVAEPAHEDTSELALEEQLEQTEAEQTHEEEPPAPPPPPPPYSPPPQAP